MNGFAISPIGFVRSRIRSFLPPEEFQGFESEILILPCFEKALEGLKEEPLILVLFRFHLSEGFSMKVHPRGDANRPLKGVFATCSPNRPNHIGLSLVKLNWVHGSTLSVEGLDALDGTPVIDIKPFREINFSPFINKFYSGVKEP
jgi:tRNA-Thr(GGU) m(6)t(6)A37 methyltransferase TsaA